MDGSKAHEGLLEKFLKVVAQAFQPVRINEAGEDARPTTFHNLRLGRVPLNGFL